MLASFVRNKAVGHILLKLTLVLTLIIGIPATTVLASNVDVLPQIQQLLQEKYVEPVSGDVLKAPTVEEALELLGDPHTVYFSPEEYQSFVGSINMSFFGIGVHINTEAEGVRVLSVISGSPAEEVGLKAGDLIIRAGGQSLVGVSTEEAVSLIRGLEGSIVQISVNRGEEIKDYAVTRREITEPTVIGEVLDGQIGYVALNSFGIETPAEFQMTVNRLKSQNINGWIIDLRNNGGGYFSAALDLAAYFIGSDVVVGVKDRTGNISQYKAPEPGFTLSQPVIFLINENSASASEILAAAVKDHQKATLVGTTTYGKGTVQTMFDLSNGGVLKMTVDHFYSPFGNKIDKVGVSPDVVIQNADSRRVAELMLLGETKALAKARTMDYWKAWGELKLSKTPDQQVEHSTLYYPSYRKVSELTAIPLDKKFTVHFNGAVNWQSINSASLELINSETGERTSAKYEALGTSDVQVVPELALDPNSTYWLVIHPSILDDKGLAMSEGVVAVASTIEATDPNATSKIQSLGSIGYASELDQMNLRNLDYGWALRNFDVRP